jgi:hypothetical protein
MQQQHFLIIPDDLINDGATLLDVRVYGNIYRQKKGCYASYATLAKWCNCERRSVITSIKRLVTMGWIVKQGGYFIPATGGVSAVATASDEATSDQPITSASDPSITPTSDQPITHISKKDISKKIISNIYTPPPPEPPLKKSIYKDGAPDILFTKEESQKLQQEHYAADLLEASDLKDALIYFQSYATNNPKKFAKYKSHYHCMIGWVKEWAIKNKRAKLALVRENTYLENTLERR